MPDVAKLRAAVVGTGFIGVVHVDAVRKELYRAVYAAVADGGMPDEPQFPTFADGHRENVIAEAVARSARERRWIEVWS
jgi:predicted dehydrogenase